MKTTYGSWYELQGGPCDGQELHLIDAINDYIYISDSRAYVYEKTTPGVMKLVCVKPSELPNSTLEIHTYHPEDYNPETQLPLWPVFLTMVLLYGLLYLVLTYWTTL